MTPSRLFVFYRHPATGLTHAAAIQAAVPSASALYSRLAASCRRLRRTSCASHWSLSLPMLRRHPARRASGPSVATTSFRRGGRFATRGRCTHWLRGNVPHHCPLGKCFSCSIWHRRCHRNVHELSIDRTQHCRNITRSSPRLVWVGYPIRP